MHNEIITLLIPPDNFSYLIISGDQTAAIDPSSAKPVLEELRKRNRRLNIILSTHFHSDHTGGNRELKAAENCGIIGGDPRIPLIDHIALDNENINIGELSVKVLSVEGHTKHQVAYYIESERAVFTGDTMFGAGCGRVFEGSAQKMYQSLMRLAQLPDNTLVYPGHEYTRENLRFAVEIEPENGEIVSRLEAVNELRNKGMFTVPSTILIEKQTNPFLRCDSKAIRKRLDMVGRSPVAVFEKLRGMKDES